MLLVGVDERGDLELGKLTDVDVGGHRCHFLPIVYYPEKQARNAAKTVLKSLSLRFALGLIRYFRTIRRIIGNRPTSVELQRYEPTFVPKLLRLPMVQVIHNEYKRDNKTDSLLGKYWFIHRINEWLALRSADRIFCVNPNIKAYVDETYPGFSRKAEVMTVSVDTEIFRPQPFDTKDGVLRLVYAGRLEEQKDPAVMFTVIKELRTELNGQVEFHYIGTGEPARYPEFAAIEDVTIRHGFQNAGGVAQILKSCHAGILTSNFEGMPCILLETLASGRPWAASAYRNMMRWSNLV